MIQKNARPYSCIRHITTKNWDNHFPDIPGRTEPKHSSQGSHKVTKAALGENRLKTMTFSPSEAEAEQEAPDPRQHADQVFLVFIKPAGSGVPLSRPGEPLLPFSCARFPMNPLETGAFRASCTDAVVFYNGTYQEAGCQARGWLALWPPFPALRLM